MAPIEVNIVDLFKLEGSLLELLIRGSILYFGILILMRIMPRRTGGELAMMDLIFVILIAEAASHAMGDYTSLTDGLVLIVVLMGWNYLINALSYRFSFFEYLVSAPPIKVLYKGQLITKNMRREFLTKEELLEKLQEQGIEDIKDVKVAYVQGNGKITFIKNKK